MLLNRRDASTLVKLFVAAFVEDVGGDNFGAELLVLEKICKAYPENASALEGLEESLTQAHQEYEKYEQTLEARILIERDYQDEKWGGNTHDDLSETLETFRTYVLEYLSGSNRAIQRPLDVRLVKSAALCLAAIEREMRGSSISYYQKELLASILNPLTRPVRLNETQTLDGVALALKGPLHLNNFKAALEIIAQGYATLDK